MAFVGSISASVHYLRIQKFPCCSVTVFTYIFLRIKGVFSDVIFFFKLDTVFNLVMSSLISCKLFSVFSNITIGHRNFGSLTNLIYKLSVLTIANALLGGLDFV